MVAPLTPKPTRKTEALSKLSWNYRHCCLLLIDKVRVRDKTYYECRYDDRLKTKAEESTRLTYTQAYTGLFVELEHLKIKTTLIVELFTSVMGEYVFLK
jgi:hypothetical protein